MKNFLFDFFLLVFFSEHIFTHLDMRVYIIRLSTKFGLLDLAWCKSEMWRKECVGAINDTAEHFHYILCCECHKMAQRHIRTRTQCPLFIRDNHTKINTSHNSFRSFADIRWITNHFIRKNIDKYGLVRWFDIEFRKWRATKWMRQWKGPSRRRRTKQCPPNMGLWPINRCDMNLK